MANLPEETIVLAYDFIEYETGQSQLFNFDGTKVWFPKQLSLIDHKNNTVEVPLWIAKEKEVEMYEDE